MGTSKRRKIDGEDESQQKSAFVLMQQLRAGGSSVAVPSSFREPSPTPSQAPMSPGPAATPARNGRRAGQRKGPSREASNPDSVATEGVSSKAKSPAPALAKQFSTFRATKQNCRKLSTGVLQLKLTESERFLVLGNFGVRVISGEVTIAGATLKPADGVNWVHAPTCHAVPVLRCCEDTKLELHPHARTTELRRLERLSPLLRGLWNDPPKGNPKINATYGFEIIYTSDDVPRKAALQDLVCPPAWNKKLADLVTGPNGKSPIILVAGPKSSGKSTFGRILGNRLLTAPSRRVGHVPAFAVLDLDPGQPEYTPAGTLALVHVKKANLSPPFTHVLPEDTDFSPIRVHAMASVSPASDPELYIEAALDLFNHYQQSALRHRPLVINSPGWILGTGLDLLTELTSRLSPTDVVYMSEEGPAETVETLRAAMNGTFSTLPSQQSELTSRTAAHLRSMQALSYFHSTKHEDGTVSWNPAPLTSVPPLIVQYGGGTAAGILGVVSYEFQPPAHLLAETINGLTLALVEIEDKRAFRNLAVNDATNGALDEEQQDATQNGKVAYSPEGIPYIPNPDSLSLDPRYSQTLGLALIRGIDTAKKTMQLLTPVPLSRIDQARANGLSLVLVHGKFDTPSWVYTEDSYAQSYREGALETDQWRCEEEGDDVTEENASEDSSTEEPEDPYLASDVAETPWVEVLKGNEKRPVGSRVWRVRRDLGKGSGGGD